jgi:DNA-binding CsgD family transcriptional regulator/Tfp pilus assembly protein PilF
MNESSIERESFLSRSVRREEENYDTPPSMISPHLVGRASQLESLHLLVEQAKRGEGHMALISGEAGIGKSRLVSEVKSYAATQGYLLLQGNCFPNDIHYPYAPLLDLLRSLYASQQNGIIVSPPTKKASTPTGKTPSRREKLERLARDIFPLLPEFVPEQTTPRVSLEPEQEKHRIFAVLANFFISLSASSPILLIIEDVHWSDSTSLDFLHTLARRTKSHPIFLMVTYRHDEVRSELSSWLAQIKRERLAQEIKLSHLSRNDVDLMLSALFDPQQTSLDMRRFLHGELLDTLYTLTEGNPFFVEETISTMIAAGNIFYALGYWNHRSQPAAPIPKSVQDAVQQRTQQMGEAAKRVLTLAAVAGRQFDFVLLQQITQHNEQQLIQILKELVSAQLVIEESAEQFAFRHALTRQAIYSRLLARERSLLHRTIAETMERYSSETPDTPLEDLAYHFYQGRVWQKAYDYAQRAGEKALRLYSHRAAIDYFTWALDAAHHLSLPPSPSLYRARGQAYETLGEFEHAQQDYTGALNAAQKMNDRIAEWQSAIDLGFRWAGSDYKKAEGWFRHALTLAESLDDPSLHARSLNRIGNWHLNVEQLHEALRYHQEALTIFQERGDKRGIAETLDLLGMASCLGGDLIQGTAYYQQVIPLFRELGDKPGLISSKASLAICGPTFQTDTMITVESLTEACQNAEDAVKIAREIGHRSGEAYALFQVGLCLGSQGEYGRAFEAVKQSLNIAEEIEHREWQIAAHTVLGGIYSSMLALPQAYVHFEQALSLADEIGSLFWKLMATGYLASAAILLHDFAQAEKLLQAALSPDTPAETMGQRLVWCASVELALAQGHPTDALEIIDRLIASSAKGAEGQNSLRIMKLRGEALVMLQRSAEAELAFEAAREIARTQGVRPIHWRISIALGSLYQTLGRKTETEQALATARTLIQELAATIADDALHDNFLQQAMAMLPHTRPLSAKHVAKSTFGGLTEREREVARLIAEGKSNQEIADSLIVSKRTIETHVGNIMFKLDCTSRTQIAVWAVDVGLVNKTETEPTT